MNNYEQQYLDLLRKVKEKGTYSKNRTGINTYKIWGAQMHIDLQQGFPLLTTKKMHLKSLVHELLWMIAGDTNIQYLLKSGVTFWTEWPYQRYVEWYNNTRSKTNDFKEYRDGPEPIQYSMKEFEAEIIKNDEFAKQWGSIGAYGYGAMWRKFPYFRDEYTPPIGEGFLERIDQLVNAIKDLKTNPDSRRIIITAWHPYHSNRKEDALLPACHNYIQFGTELLTEAERLNLWQKTFALPNGAVPSCLPNLEGKDFHARFDKDNIPKYRLNCYFNMRSNDVPLGLPYNIAFYALFTHLVARCVNMVPSKLVYTAADVHIYENQLDGINEQLTRKPGALPKLKLSSNCPTNIFDIKFEDIEIADYMPQTHIKMPVAV